MKILDLLIFELVGTGEFGDLSVEEVEGGLVLGGELAFLGGDFVETWV